MTAERLFRVKKHGQPSSLQKIETIITQFFFNASKI